MKVTILRGSPRKNGNTAALTTPFVEHLQKKGVEVKDYNLQDLTIHSCIACRNCQKDWTKFGCIYEDGVQDIFDDILDSDGILLAVPIYSWYCTAPMKALLDRLMYGMNKYYGETRGPALWKGKKLGLLITCGYAPEKGADLFVEGMKRYAKHSQLLYTAEHIERHMGYNTVFLDDDKISRTLTFADQWIEMVK